jgi:hypothetical protein
MAVTLSMAGVATLLQAAPALQKGGDKTTFCIALGADNKPVGGLTKDDFAIREDNVDRTVVGAKQATDPLDLVLIIDTSKSVGSSESISPLRLGLQAFAKTIFAGSAPVNMSIVDSAGASITVADNKKSYDDVQKTLEKTFADQTGNTVILEAMNDAAQKLGKSPSARRAIVVVNMDAISEGSSLKSQDVVVKVAQSGASLWAVTYQNQLTKNLKNGGGGIGTGNVGQSRDFVLEKAAPLGGLRAQITAPVDLPTVLTTLADIIVGQYAVTYTRPEGPMPKLFQMATTRPDVKIGYNQFPVK